MPPKECPPGKILNPKTNRCVDSKGKIGKAIVGKTECPEGTILNPKTGRCVNINGKIGKAKLKLKAIIVGTKSEYNNSSVSKS